MIVSAARHRCTTTPNGTMITLASPTLGAATGALWLVEMHPGAAGPGGAERQLVAGPDGFSAVTAAADAVAAEVTRGDGTSAGVPPWVA